MFHFQLSFWNSSVADKFAFCVYFAKFAKIKSFLNVLNFKF